MRSIFFSMLCASANGSVRARPRSRWAALAGARFKEAVGAGVIAVFIFGLSEGLCRLAERPLAQFTGGQTLRRDYEKLVKLNSRGLRDPERPLEKPPGTWRLVVLGDSFMFGQGVREESTCVRHLERDLAVPGGPRVEVINTAHVGTTRWPSAPCWTRSACATSPTWCWSATRSTTRR